MIYFHIFSDIFDDFFGFGGRRSGSYYQSYVKKGSNLRIRIKLSLEEILTGIEKKITIQKKLFVINVMVQVLNLKTASLLAPHAMARDR